MSEHPLLNMIMDAHRFVGGSVDIEDQVEPIDSQRNFGPGDVALVASANSPLEQDLVFVQCLPPDSFPEEYPDWEERVGPGAHVLCTAFSKEDNELTTGWYHRIKLMPINQEQYQEVLHYLEDGWPEKMPEWLFEVYKAHTAAMAEQAPSLVPKVVTCPNPECGSNEIMLRVQKISTRVALAGVLVRDGKEMFVPINEQEHDVDYDARIECTDCHAYAALKEGEWHINMSRD